MSHFALPLLAVLWMPHPPVTILALGDSYTIGESVEVADRWPNQLQDMLQKQGLDVAPPQIIAKTGWTTDELSNAIKEATLKPNYDFVTLLIGVNNQYRGRSAEVYRQELRELIQFAIKKAQNDPRRVIVLSIPDWGVTPFAQGRDREKIAMEIDTYNQVKREEAERAQVQFVYITDISRDVQDTNQGLIASDGLHPSAQMYKLWAQQALPLVLKTLRP